MPVDMEVSLRKQLEKSICSEGKGLEGKMIRVFLDGTLPLMEFEKQVTDWGKYLKPICDRIYKKITR